MSEVFENSNSIAILMATYNAEKYLSEQIESIISQTCKDWSLYIRDDGSHDRTNLIIQDYVRRYSNIYELNDHEGNLGCRDNFFKLLDSIDSRYYMFSDADDVWLPTKIEESYELIKKNEADYSSDVPILVHSDMVVVDEKLQTIAKSMWECSRFNPDKIKNINYLGLHGFVGGATSIFNRAAKNISKPFSQDVYLHDLWIGLKVLEQGKLISLHKPLMLYRQHSTNTAGAGLASKLKLSYKIKNMRQIIKVNISTATMLKKIGWGGYIKYLYYKTKLFFIIRSGKAL